MLVTVYIRAAQTDNQLTYHLTTHYTSGVCYFGFANFFSNTTSNLYCLKINTTEHFQLNLGN